MQKTEISVSVLLTIAVSLLTMGTTLLNEGDYYTSVPCIIVGFGLIVAAIILFEKGIIEKLKKEGKQ